MPGLRRLHVTALGGAVTIDGQVRSFYEKQVINHCCLDVPGVSRLHNAVRVDGVHAHGRLLA
jgi:osmotically-inducible protein OsmY